MMLVRDNLDVLEHYNDAFRSVEELRLRQHEAEEALARAHEQLEQTMEAEDVSSARISRVMAKVEAAEVRLSQARKATRVAETHLNAVREMLLYRLPVSSAARIVTNRTWH